MVSKGSVFHVPSVEEMELITEQQQKVAPRSHFCVGSLSQTRISTKGQSEDFDAAKRQRIGLEKATFGNCETAPATTKFAECFSKLTESSHHKEIQQDLRNMIAEAPNEMPLAPVPTAAKTNCVLVNSKQRGNPLLRSIYNVPWEFSDIIPDYVMGKTTCALFLSLRYHNLFPNYIHERLKDLGRLYTLRLLLVQVDVKDPHHPLKDLTKIAIMADCTLLLAWSPEEAGRHIETYKIFENKPPDMLMKRQEADSYQKVIDALTSIKSVNRNDAIVLLSTFGTFENITKASKDDLGFCPGIGPLKARRLYTVLHQGFLKSSSKKR